MGVAGGGEQRLLQQIFPIARERRPGDQPTRHRVGAPAAAGQDDVVVIFQLARVAQRQGRQIQRLQRHDQPKACRRIYAQGVSGNAPPVAGDQGDLLGLGDQIADGQDQACLADHDAIAQALDAQGLGG